MPTGCLQATPACSTQKLTGVWPDASGLRKEARVRQQKGSNSVIPVHRHGWKAERASAWKSQGQEKVRMENGARKEETESPVKDRMGGGGQERDPSLTASEICISFQAA